MRNWGALIALSGAMLIHGAYHPPVRPPILAFSAFGKLMFIVLVLAQGGRYLGEQAGLVIVIDGIMVALFIAYFVSGDRGGRSRDS